MNPFRPGSTVHAFFDFMLTAKRTRSDMRRFWKPKNHTIQYRQHCLKVFKRAWKDFAPGTARWHWHDKAGQCWVTP